MTFINSYIGYVCDVKYYTHTSFLLHGLCVIIEICLLEVAAEIYLSYSPCLVICVFDTDTRYSITMSTYSVWGYIFKLPGDFDVKLGL